MDPAIVFVRRTRRLRERAREREKLMLRMGQMHT